MIFPIVITFKWLLFFPVVICFLPDMTYGLTFNVEPKAIVLQPGGTANIRCQVSGFDPKSNTIFWIKRQENHTEHDTIATRDYINLNKYKERVSVEIDDDDESSSLIINNIKLIDSGYYGCTVGKKDSQADADWARLSVVDPVKDVKLFRNSSGAEEELSGEVSFTSPGINLRCLVSGGNPAADVKITLDDEDVTNNFRKHTRETVEDNGETNMNIIRNNVSLFSSEPLQVEPVNTPKTLTCIASVPEHPPVSANVKLTMTGIGLTCTSEKSDVGEDIFQINVKCKVNTNAGVKSAEWKWQGHTLIPGQSNNSTTTEEGREEGDFLIFRLKHKTFDRSAPVQSFEFSVEDNTGEKASKQVLSDSGSTDEPQASRSSGLSPGFLLAAVLFYFMI